ncbi:MAG: M15 family metallopeptidase [Colwellia sp.]
MTNLSEELLGQSSDHIYYINPTIAIHKQMITAYKELVANSKLAGIDLKIASGFRSFERQLMIWNNKYTGKTPIKDARGNIVDIQNLSALEIINAILLYSALPGASRHHWGCDIDIYASNLLPKGQKLQLEPWEYAAKGPFEKLSIWLDKYAEKIGFYRPYEQYNGGVAAEPWHLSYEPIATAYQEIFNIDTLACCLHDSNIEGKEIILNNLPEIIQRYTVQTNISVIGSELNG